MNDQGARRIASPVILAAVVHLVLLVCNHAASARVGDGRLWLRWSGVPAPGIYAVLSGPAGGSDSVRISSAAEARAPLPGHHFGPVPAGLARLELHDPAGALIRSWRIPLAAELTTVAVLNLDTDSLAVDPVHPDPFGNWETFDRTECELLPGRGPQGVLNMDTRPNLPRDPSIDESGPQPVVHERPRPFALENEAVAMQIPLQTLPAALGSDSPWILTYRPGATTASAVAGGGSAGRSFAQAEGRYDGRVPALGRVEAAGTFQGLLYQDAGPAGVATGRLPHNRLEALETRASAFYRPGPDRLARFDFYAYGQQRRYFLQEFRYDTAHAPREDRADLHGSASYDFRAGPARISVNGSYARALNKTGDGDAFDMISAYDTGLSSIADEHAVSKPGLYWNSSPLGGISPHLYNYFEQDLATTWKLGADGQVRWTPGNPLRVGGTYQTTSYRWYEQLEPIDAAAGNPGALTNYTSHLGYATDLNVHTDSGPNGPRHPKWASLFASQRAQVGDLAVEGGARWESFRSGERPVRNPADPTGGRDNIASLDDASLEPEPSRSAVDPRIGLYFPLGRTHLWADAGVSRENPPYEALYYSPNVLLNQASLARKDNLGTIRNVIFGNPGLKPEATRAAQLGFFRQLNDRLSLRGAARLAQVRDTWTAAQYHASGKAGGTNDVLNYYENRGRRREMGLHLGAVARTGSRSRLRVLYDLSRTETNVIEPATLYRNLLLPDSPLQSAASYETRPIVPVEFDTSGPGSYFPSLFDHRHRLAAEWIDHLGATAGGELLSWILGDADVAITFRSVSGAPYTPTDLQETGGLGPRSTERSAPGLLPGTPRDVNGNGVTDHSEINSARMPWSWQSDLSLRRLFHVLRGDLTFLFEVRNVTGEKNAQVVYGYTGSADDDGWLSALTSTGETNAQAVGDAAAALYSDRVDNPLNYQEGRTFRVSLSFSR